MLKKEEVGVVRRVRLFIRLIKRYGLFSLRPIGPAMFSSTLNLVTRVVLP